MTTPQTLQSQLQVCDELYQLAHEENRHLKEQRRAPDAGLLARKRSLLERLTDSLAQLRAGHTGETSREARPFVEKVRSRILQILNLDKENEQLLLRVSLTRGIEPAATPAPASPAMLARIYARPAK